jgi:hypothetical protein
MQQMDSTIEVKFKTLDGTSHSISFNPKKSIKELKNKIAWELRVNEEKLVVIFRGKKLEDHGYLEQYNYEEGKTLNVIARKAEKQSKNNLNEKRENVESSLINLENLGNVSLRGNDKKRGDHLRDELNEIQREINFRDQDEGQIFSNIFKVNWRL